MSKVQDTIGKILAKWTTIGSFLIMVASFNIIPVPDFLIELFSQGTAEVLVKLLDSVVATVGLAITTFQVIRGIVVGGTNEGEVKVLSLESASKMSKNPFSLG